MKFFREAEEEGKSGKIPGGPGAWTRTAATLRRRTMTRGGGSGGGGGDGGKVSRSLIWKCKESEIRNFPKIFAL